MIKTKEKTRKHIANLSLDIEIVNPIESKSLFGGCGYNQGSWCSCTGPSFGTSSYNNMGWTFPTFSNPYSGPTDNSWGTSGNDSSNTYDQNNNGVPDYEEASFVDNNGDGINDADMQQIYDLYPGDLSAPEALWLYMHPTYISAMYSNQQLAFSLAPGLNGVGDAFRHALWSALDAFDIGSENAHEFHTLHETTHWHDEQSPSDLHNNGWGYNWAIMNGDPQANMTQFLSDFDAAVANGHLSILP